MDKFEALVTLHYYAMRSIEGWDIAGPSEDNEQSIEEACKTLAEVLEKEEKH